eukprot:1543196-Ditylum_brightwellii.AAC.1
MVNNIVLMFLLYFAYTCGHQLLCRLIPQESRTIVTTFLIIVNMSVRFNLQTTHKSLDGGTLYTYARQSIGQDGN